MEAGWRGVDRYAIKELFGRPLRVALAAWILARRGEAFYLQEAQRAMDDYGQAGSGVAKELRLFEAHAMVMAAAVGRRVYFTPLDSVFWPAFEAIAEACGLVDIGPASSARFATELARSRGGRPQRSEDVPERQSASRAGRRPAP